MSVRWFDLCCSGGARNTGWLRDGMWELSLSDCQPVTWSLNLSFPLLFSRYIMVPNSELFQWPLTLDSL